MTSAIGTMDDPNSLEHYGRKGMKWGEHIFGRDTRTNAQRKAAGAKKKALRKAALEKRKQEKAKVKAEKIAKELEKNKQKWLDSPTQLYKHRKEFNKEEIDAAMARFKWEESLRESSKKEMEAGKNYINAISNYAASMIALYNTAARLNNTFRADGDESRWPYIENTDASKNPKKKK